MMNTNTIRINKEATLTSNGTRTNGNCKPIIAIEAQKTFNSMTDAAEFFGVHLNAISAVLNGRQTSIRMYERDENGNKIHYIGPCHLEFARNAASAMDRVLEVGRKANEKIAELEQKAALWDAYQKDQEAARKAEEDRQAKIAKATEKRDKRYNKYILAMGLYEEAERELSALLEGGKANA